LGLWSASDSVSLTPNSTATADFRLVPACSGTIDATVYSADTGLPLAGAEVNYGRGSETTAADGTVEFDNVPLGFDNTAVSYSLQATDSSGRGVTVGYPEVTLNHCGDVASASLDVHVPVTNTGSASLTVLDSVTNQPIPSADVTGYFDECGTDQNPVTGVNGVYTFPSLVVGQDSTTSASCEFAITAPGYYGDYPTYTINSGLTTRATIKLVPELTTTVTGRVTDSVTGLPIAGIQVGDYTTTLTDANGDYTLTNNQMLGVDNAPTTTTVGFSDSTGAYLSAYPSVNVAAGQTETLNVALDPQCGPATVSGTIYNASDQQPIPGASVVDNDDRTEDTADQNGQWSLQVPVYNNQPFADSFTASATGFNPKTESIEIFCGAHIRLDFGDASNETGTLTGTVTSASTGLPVAGAFVGAGFGATTTTDSSGNYTFTNVPTGNGNAAEQWDVTVKPPSGSPLESQIKSVSVPPEATTRLDFALTDTPPPLPVAPNYSFSTPEGTELSVPAADGALSKATGVGIMLTGYATTSASEGYVTLNPDGSFTYTPIGSRYVGTDSFKYTVTDEYGVTATGTISVHVTGSTPAPVAVDDTGSTPYATPLVVAAPGVLGNDTGTGIAVTAHTAPSHGTVSIDSDGSYTYTPDSGYAGQDSFTYTITDATSRTSTATVHLTVADPAAPVANADSGSTPYATPLVVAAPGVLGNDTGTGIAVTAHTAPSHGTVSIKGDGSYTYTPASGYAGSDSFTYTITDVVGQTASAKVSLTVAAPGAPVAVDDTGSTPYATPLVVAAPGVLGNDAGTGISVTGHTAPSHGTVSIKGDGAYTYTPAAGFAGSDSFTYTITDAVNQTATATVSLTVAPPTAPVAADDTGSTPYATPLVVAAPGVLGNDSGTGIVVTGHTAPSHGTVSIKANGSYTYTPAAGFAGSDSFAYTITDVVGQTASAKVSLTVVAPKPPVANKDAGTTPYATPLVVAAPGVLGNDTGTGISVTAHTSPMHGTVSIKSDGAYTYTPSSSFSGSDSFTYTITDVVGQTATATVQLTVSSPIVVPHPPVITLVDPNTGPVVGGTAITLTGKQFTGATEVIFGTTDLTSGQTPKTGLRLKRDTTAPTFEVVSSTEITLTDPPGTGTVDIRVVTPMGTSALTSRDRFSYQAASTPTPTPTPTPTQTATPTSTPTASASPTPTPKPSQSTTSSASLPGTGINVVTPLALAAGLLAAGAVALFAGRRRYRPRGSARWARHR
jgi:VCBS repeat-containing protein